jgi:hypothetical protein
VGGPVEGRLIFMIVTLSVVLATRGVELCLDGSSDTLGELANGHVRVESRPIVDDGVSIALMWYSTAP